MARTIKIAKYIQVPGSSTPLRPLRRAPARPPALFLLQLRSSSVPQFSPRRLTIAINAPGNPDAWPEAVKIKHT
jgi:hypothetical protein